jgi:hypothetical protein
VAVSHVVGDLLRADDRRQNRSWSPATIRCRPGLIGPRFAAMNRRQEWPIWIHVTIGGVLSAAIVGVIAGLVALVVTLLT